MIRLHGFIHLRCNQCGRMFRVNLNDFNYEDSGSASERPMGIGIDYSFPVDIFCPACDSHITVEIEASEYPVGSLELSNVSINGAEYTRIPEIEIDYAPEEDLEYCQSPNQISPKEKIEIMSSREFELFVGSIFVERGCTNVRVTQRTRDGGFDFEAQDNNRGISMTIIGECKHYDKRRHVGIDIIRELHDVQLRKHANIAIVVTSSYFTQDAIDLACEYSMQLWDSHFLENEGTRLGLL